MVTDVRAQSTNRQPVIALLYPDGYVELYGSDQIDPVIINVPQVATQQGEVVAERFVESMLPQRHRQIFAPGYVRDARLHRVITVEEIANTIQDVTILRTVDALKSLIADGVVL